MKDLTVFYVGTSETSDHSMTKMVNASIDSAQKLLQEVWELSEFIEKYKSMTCAIEPQKFIAEFIKSNSVKGKLELVINNLEFLNGFASPEIKKSNAKVIALLVKTYDDFDRDTAFMKDEILNFIHEAVANDLTYIGPFSEESLEELKIVSLEEENEEMAERVR